MALVLERVRVAGPPSIDASSLLNFLGGEGRASGVGDDPAQLSISVLLRFLLPVEHEEGLLSVVTYGSSSGSVKGRTITFLPFKRCAMRKNCDINQ